MLTETPVKRVAIVLSFHTNFVYQSRCPEVVAREGSIKNVCLKILRSPWKTSVLEPLFHKVSGVQCTILLLEKKLQHRCFPVNFVRLHE